MSAIKARLRERVAALVLESLQAVETQLHDLRFVGGDVVRFG